ncbi:MAG: nucleoid occlusion factor SlmA [Gammaproteobacteria bacterium]|nr:nucleoid occlusion factor SlmA [Gammaproteobacteria bacterium]
MPRPRRGERRQDILQALAQQLEEAPGAPVTTAALARAVGVSEAALYRHFPSKARMYDALFGFVEETIFSRMNRICEEQQAAESRLKQMLTLWLVFADRNHGLAYLLQGAALAGEADRLRERLAQIYERFETHLRQVLRDSPLRAGAPAPAVCAQLLLACVDGRVAQAVRGRFRQSPLDNWEEQWQVLRAAFFDGPPVP